MSIICFDKIRFYSLIYSIYVLLHLAGRHLHAIWCICNEKKKKYNRKLLEEGVNQLWIQRLKKWRTRALGMAQSHQYVCVCVSIGVGEIYYLICYTFTYCTTIRLQLLLLLPRFISLCLSFHSCHTAPFLFPLTNILFCPHVFVAILIIYFMNIIRLFMCARLVSNVSTYVLGENKSISNKQRRNEQWLISSCKQYENNLSQTNCN